jgi:anti-sigma B factor antagonist
LFRFGSVGLGRTDDFLLRNNDIIARVSRMIAADPRAETGPWFSLALLSAGEKARLQASGELDLAATPKLAEQVAELVAAGFRHVVIDLRRVTFIDLTGVRLLLKLADDARDEGWRLSLLQVGGQVRQILMLTGVLGRLPVSDTAGALPPSV